MWNAIQCSGKMAYYQNRVIYDENKISFYDTKMEQAQSTQDSITESLEYSKSVWEELTQSTRENANYLLESSVKDARKDCDNAKAYYEQLKNNGAPESEIQKAKETYNFATDVLNRKNQELADAKNNTEALIQSSKTLTNQYFDKQKEAQLKNAQKLEKQYSTQKAKWEKRKTTDEAAYKGYENGFNSAVESEFTPKFAKQ